MRCVASYASAILSIVRTVLLACFDSLHCMLPPLRLESQKDPVEKWFWTPILTALALISPLQEQEEVPETGHRPHGGRGGQHPKPYVRY